MAQFDVYLLASGEHVVNVQTDLLEPLNTCIVIPLIPAEHAPKPARRLNPVFEIEGQNLVLVTQFMAAVSKGELRQPVASLEPHRDELTAALDMVFQGF